MLNSNLPKTPFQLLQLKSLALMPDYAQVRHLDLWEYQLQEIFAINIDPINSNYLAVNSIIEALFELARVNLYSQFNPNLTFQAYLQLQQLLKFHHIDVPSQAEIVDF